MIFCGLCVGEDGACCDFCRFYAFNADKQGRYTGDGRCMKHDTPKDPGDVCDDFHCENATAPEKD